MSSLPVSDPYNIAEDSEFLGSLDNSWSLYQQILQSSAPWINNNEEAINNNSITDEATMDSAARILDINGLKLMKIRSPNSKTRKKNTKIMEQSAEEGPSVAKKLDHNAKERIRRMKLNASYLALRALLPDSRRSKKRWSAPAIVDRVLKYIPELENEVESLRSHKENLQSEAKNKKIIANEKHSLQEYQSRTVSLNQVNEEEAIIQICMEREDELGFTNLLQSVEDEDICIKSASALYICETRICYHLHIQIDTTSQGDYYIDELRDKVNCWLR